MKQTIVLILSLWIAVFCILGFGIQYIVVDIKTKCPNGLVFCLGQIASGISKDFKEGANGNNKGR